MNTQTLGQWVAPVCSKASRPPPSHWGFSVFYWGTLVFHLQSDSVLESSSVLPTGSCLWNAPATPEICVGQRSHSDDPSPESGLVSVAQYCLSDRTVFKLHLETRTHCFICITDENFNISALDSA